MASDTQAKVKAKLADLRNEYLDSDMEKRITDTEQALRRNIAAKELAKIDAVQQIIEVATKAIKDISWLLANDEDITDVQRQALFAEKRVHIFWLERLDGSRATQAIEAIEETVDSLTHRRAS